MKEKILQLLQMELDIAIKMKDYVENSKDMDIDTIIERSNRYDAVARKLLDLINVIKEDYNQ